MKRNILPVMLLTGLAVTMVAAPGCTGKRVPQLGETKEVKKLLSMDDVKDDLAKEVEGERYQILYTEKDGYKGAQNPTITIVEYSDFQCPFCKRLSDGLDKILAENPDDIRIVFKHYPLPMHKDAHPASQATLAAGAQGKFWEMHDKVFVNTKALKREKLDGYAQEIGLDMAKFKKDMDEGAFKKQVDDDMAQGTKFAVRSTPSFFVNGKSFRGALPPEKLQKIIEEEKKQAEKLIKAGSKREEVYWRIMRAAKTEKKAEPRSKRQQPGRPDPSANYAVPTGEDRPRFGPDDALVTIVEYSDFQCPFCSRVNPALKQIKEEFKKDVRLVFRQQPLPFHKEAGPAAKAALAAHRQGKFWEMHDKLFENQKELNEEAFIRHAKGMGLNVAKFTKDMKDPKLDEMIKEDQAVAQKFGASGTPAFFVNGRFLSGAAAFETFEKVIKEEIKKAEKFMADKGVSRRDLYDEMLKTWDSEIKQPPIADHKRREVDVKGLPHKGNKRAKVTIVECGDFDCPFCKRGTETAGKVVKEYGDKVAVYWRNYPLPMHKMAEPAHRAAVAADKQGKFWEMHDKLFADKSKRSDEQLEEIAQEVGLDVGKWRKDFNDPGTAQKVKDDVEVCSKYGVRGAPGFIINGRLMSGAQPLGRFKKVIDEELAGGFEKKKG